ncbi:hypothetical protein M3J09_013365 [Ascochyta lentis]
MQPINIQNLSCGRFTSRCRASYREPVGSASSSADCLQGSVLRLTIGVSTNKPFRISMK